MQELRQSTAVNVMLGVFVDSTDGATTEETLTLAQADLQLSKNGAAAAQKNDATSATHRYGGNYSVPLNATDTDTLGALELMCKKTGALPLKRSFMVVNQNYWDSKYGTDKLQVDVTQLLGTAWLTPETAGTPDVNAKQIGGIAQTGNDVGADVDAILIDTAEIGVAGAGLTALGDTRLAELEAANLPADIDAIKAKTDNQPAGIPKNVALSNFEFLMVLSSDHITPATGKTLTGEISKDGGAFASCTNAASEIGNGVYKIDLTQTEMNANIITLKFTETNCDQRTITIKTSI